VSPKKVSRLALASAFTPYTCTFSICIEDMASVVDRSLRRFLLNAGFSRSWSKASANWYHDRTSRSLQKDVFSVVATLTPELIAWIITMKWNSFLILLIFTCMARPVHADESFVARIRSELRSKPREAVDQLNRTWVFDLLNQKEYAAVEEFAITGTIAVADDPTRIEQLQKHRIEALLAEGRSQEALSAAKALFNICSMHFVVEALPLLTKCIAAAHPKEPQLVAKFKLQVLANAQEDPAERERLRAKFDNNSVMMSIPADSEPYAKAIRDLSGKSDYTALVSTANLELLSGNIQKASKLLDRAYRMAPPADRNSATEGLARKLKAEDGGVGRANQFIVSIRPGE